MLIANDAVVAEIPGISEAQSALLARHGIFTVFDVLWAPGSVLAESAGGEALARTWRTCARLMQVDGVNGTIARALTDGGVGGLDELSSRRVSKLAELLQRPDVGLAPELVTTDALGIMIADAMRIRSTAVLHLELVGSGGRPLIGAIVRVGQAHETADARGRVRVIRIAARNVEPVIVPVSGEVRVLAGIRALDDAEARALVRIRVDALPVLEDASEFDGQPIPEPAPGVHRQETRPADALRHGDVLRVLELPGAGNAVLVSIFRELRKGDVFAIRFKVDRSVLPANVAPGAYLRYAHGAFRMLRMTPARISFLRRAQRLRSLLPAEGAGQATRKAIHAWLKEAIETRVLAGRTEG